MNSTTDKDYINIMLKSKTQQIILPTLLSLGKKYSDIVLLDISRYLYCFKKLSGKENSHLKS